MAHRVDRIPRYDTDFLNSYAGPSGELLQDIQLDELVMQNGKPGGVRFANKSEVSNLGGAVDFLQHGGVADPNVDNTDALNVAMLYAYQNGKKAVIIPAGEYGFAGECIMQNGVSLIGLGYVVFNRISTNCHVWLLFPPEADAAPADYTYFGLSNIAVKNIIFKINGPQLNGIADSDTGGCEAMSLGFCSNILIENCEFWDRIGTHTIECSGSKFVTIRNCRFYGGRENRADAMQPTDREHIQIEYCGAGACAVERYMNYGGKFYVPCADITVERCLFTKSKVLGADCPAVGCHNAIEDQYSAFGVRILNCTFERCRKWAVAFYTSKNYVVDGCVFRDCFMAVRAVCVRGNVDRNGQAYGHGKAPNGLVFTNNFCEAAADSSEYIYYTRTDSPDEPDVRIRNVIIKNNVFVHNNPDAGMIALRFHLDTLIEGNIFRGTYNVVVSNLYGDFTFNNNTCIGYRKNGIWCNEESVSVSGSLSRNLIVTNNEFVGDHTEETGRSIAVHGTSAEGLRNTGLIIKGNTIRSNVSTDNFVEPIIIDRWDYSVISNNTVFCVKYPADKAILRALSTDKHMSIGPNALLPLSTDPNGTYYGHTGRAENEQFVMGNTIVKGADDGAPACVSVYGANYAYNCLSIAGIGPADVNAPAYLLLGVHHWHNNDVQNILQVGHDYTTRPPYVRPLPSVYGESTVTTELGTGGYRWANVYVQTNSEALSDARIKQYIQPIDDALLDAWASVEYKQFKFIDSVTKKGDDARVHTGLIAQDLMDKIPDVDKYGFFCYDVFKTPAGETKDEYSLRYVEALIVEVAYLRRELKRVQARFDALEQKNGATN